MKPPGLSHRIRMLYRHGCIEQREAGLGWEQSTRLRDGVRMHQGHVVMRNTNPSTVVLALPGDPGLGLEQC